MSDENIVLTKGNFTGVLFYLEKKTTIRTDIGCGIIAYMFCLARFAVFLKIKLD